MLVTGHTGFKGSWLCLWLVDLGANVYGISDQTHGVDSHWLGLNLDISEDFYDIADFDKLNNSIQTFKPDIILHLAAQSLVRRSYREPYQTLKSNVVGTMNVLESIRLADKAVACLVVTSDKCYDNKEWLWGYREIDSLGGNDVYSASKAMCEILTHSYRESFFKDRGTQTGLIATARAGNVIGVGDWSEDRLVPDIVRSVLNKENLVIRSPSATRPWQHVLDCLQGYLILGSELLLGNTISVGAWNFGPDISSNKSVKNLVSALDKNGLGAHLVFKNDDAMPEAHNLYLDSSKARKHLRWEPIWDFSETVKMTASWYNCYLDEELVISSGQLEKYINDAKVIGADFANYD